MKESDEFINKSENELKFYYNREERLEMAEKYIPVYEKKPFWKNTSLMILLLDSLVIILIFIIYNIFLSPKPWEAKFEDYKFSLDAVYFDDRIIGYVDIYFSGDTGNNDFLIPVFYWGTVEKKIDMPLPVQKTEKKSDKNTRFRFDIENIKNNDSQELNFYVLLKIDDSNIVLQKRLKRK
ncbi:hypothetical protein WKV44_08465 [Spirochaetia bacterium 38H-sp]|uniref:Uncharacterized protein n=1 Tax=Rarispira pelagica TaxID=3141764 RepID=A0ABU9UD27_9SPIR